MAVTTRITGLVGACVLALATALVAATWPSDAAAGRGDDYLRWVAFEAPGHENVVLRWPRRKMPLAVYLPRPPAGLFDDPDAIYDSVRDGVLDWTDVAGKGVPSFRFVDDAGEADIPVVWAAEPTGDWFIAYCFYDVNVFQRRFGVARILVTARWKGGRVADLHDVYATVLHEMGHALGLGGHSPDPGDVMYESISRTATSGLSARDRATLTALYARPIGARIGGARH